MLEKLLPFLLLPETPAACSRAIWPDQNRLSSRYLEIALNILKPQNLNKLIP